MNSQFYIFNADVAQETSVFAATIYHNIFHWVLHSEANEVKYHDGKYWTFNSVKAFGQIFPFATQKQIRKAIDDLVEAGYIVKGYFNRNKLDRTLWYSLTDKIPIAYGGSCNSQKKETDLPKKGNVYTDINYTDINYLNRDILYNARTREKFAEEARNSTIKKEQICKSLDITPAQFDRFLDEVLLDWEICDVSEQRCDWSYLLNCLRIKVKKSSEVLNERINRNPIDERRQKLLDEIRPLLGTYGRKTCNDFFNYWSESDEQGVMRFERLETFNVKARLKRWARNNEQP